MSLNHHASLTVICCLLWHGLCTATAAVVIVNGNGIVIATDSKAGLKDTVNMTLGSRPDIKITAISDNVVFECVDTCSFTEGEMMDGEQKMFHYDVATGILDLKRSGQLKPSFDDFISSTERYLRKVKPVLQHILSEGMIKQQDAANLYEMYSQAVFAGYDGGVARVSAVELYIDWNSKEILGPYTIDLSGAKHPAAENRAYSFGLREASFEVLNGNSYAYKSAMSCCAEAIKQLSANRPISLKVSAAFARRLIQIEEQTNPNEVGGVVQIIGIPLKGKARDLTHSEESTSEKKGNAKKAHK